MQKYDTDITRWSPDGKLHQMEYAKEAVKKGNASVGLRSKTHVVLVALKRSPQAELASYQEKVFKLDPKMGMAIAGLTSDARELAHYLRTECMNHRYVFETMVSTARVVEDLADKHQFNTMIPGRRPYGVGCLIAGHDETGARLFQSCPSGNFYDYIAMAIGNRSQSARTYLENHFKTFADMPLDDLVKHGLRALATTCQDGVELKPENTTVAVVGVDTNFEVYNDESAKSWLDTFHAAPEPTTGTAEAGEAEPAEAPMETDA